MEDAFNILEKNLKELGFDRVVYSLITDHPSLQLKKGHGILRNYPDDWMKYYYSKDYFEVDPVIKVIKQTSGPFLWNKLPELKNGLDKDEHVLMEEAREAKLLDGIGISLHGAYGEIVGMGVASSSGQVDLDRNTVSLVYSLCTQFHVLYRNMEEKSSPIIQLSKREKEVMNWAASGKSRGVIADILNISDETVKTYIERIFIKLQVSSIQMAVVKAISLGLITPDLCHNHKILSE
ncbi:MAG: LuxR family transcriptional regulator [Rickettsiales bacterium]